MSCPQNPLARGHLPLDYEGAPPANASPLGNIHLFLSNSPETIDSLAALPMTLYKHGIPIGTLPTRIRVFVWHTNETGSLIGLGLLVSTSNGVSATAYNLSRQISNGPPPLSTGGICIAKAQLFDTLDSFGSTTSFAASEFFLADDLVADGSTIGYVMEFDVVASGSCNLQLRTAAHAWTARPGSYALDPNPLVPSDNHPRGYWPHSELVVDCGSFDATVGPTRRTRQIICCSDGGPEEDEFPPVNAMSSTNDGLYGVDLNYQCLITCDPESVGLLHVYILALMTAEDGGFEYFGATEITSWQMGPDWYIPPIKWTNPNGADPQLNIVNITQSGPLTVGFPYEAMLNVRVANAGAATMPFLLLLTNLAYNIAE